MPLLLLLFVVVPFAELVVIMRVAAAISLPWTLLLLVGMSVAGAVLVKREGARAWQRFTAAIGDGRMPAAEVVDGALVLIGGTLMVTPGFLTDVVGLLCVVPGSRHVLNRAVRARVRTFVVPGGAAGGLAGAVLGGRGAGGGPRRRGAPDEEPIDVDVVSVERMPPHGEEPGTSTGPAGGRLGPGERG